MQGRDEWMMVEHPETPNNVPAPMTATSSARAQSAGPETEAPFHVMDPSLHGRGTAGQTVWNNSCVIVVVRRVHGRTGLRPHRELLGRGACRHAQLHPQRQLLVTG